MAIYCKGSGEFSIYKREVTITVLIDIVTSSRIQAARESRLTGRFVWCARQGAPTLR